LNLTTTRLSVAELPMTLLKPLKRLPKING
jgi:hypothetical protein